MGSSLFNAIDWLAAVLTGPAATGLGVLAMALLGFATLGGRLDKRRAMQVLLGLFLLFAAPTLVIGLQRLLVADGSQSSTQSRDDAQAKPKAICWTCG